MVSPNDNTSVNYENFDIEMLFIHVGSVVKKPRFKAMYTEEIEHGVFYIAHSFLPECFNNDMMSMCARYLYSGITVKVCSILSGIAVKVCSILSGISVKVCSILSDIAVKVCSILSGIAVKVCSILSGIAVKVCSSV